MVGKVDRSPLLGQVAPRVEQAEQLVEARRGGLHRVEQLAELLHGLEEVRQQQHERDDGAERDLSLVHEPSADADDRRGRGDAGELDQREVPHRDSHGLHVRVVEGAVALGEPSPTACSRPNAWMTRTPVMPSCSDERFCPMRSRMVRYALFESRWNLTDAIATIGTEMKHTSVSFHDITTSKASEIASSSPFEMNCSKPELHQLGHRVDVGRHARHQHAGLLALEEAERQRLHVVEHSDAQVAQEPLADATDGHDLHSSDHVGDRSDDHIGDDRAVQRLRVAVGQPMVDREAHEEGARDDGQRPDDDEQARADDGRSVRPQHVRRRRVIRRRACSRSSLSSSLTAPAPHMAQPPAAVAAHRSLSPGGEHHAVPLALAEQRVVGALGHDPAVLEQHHPVGERDRRGTVRDHDRGAAAHHLGERVADLVLLRRVDCARGVVEDQHARVGDDRTRDRDALTLPARQREAPLADQRVVAVGQLRDEVVRTRQT